jgi:LmbE family N-acetylglucosaminyl deacetylase
MNSIGLWLAPLLAVSAQSPRQPDAAELARALDRLAVVGNVLYIAAHPDDENTRLLAYLANERLLRTAYLSLTRGDGGQNLIGAEQGALLGLIRTEELLAARRIDGAEQYFTRARDFGYSKTAAETLSIWGHDAVLADVVWVIRSFRPDVIVTRFSPTGTDTHGHHTASAMLALEAFRAAADPAFHPEQLKHVGVWQARRIVWNKGVFGAKPNEDLSAFLKMDIGAYNPMLGLSYGELAAASRSMHKSQGFGAAPARGPAPEYFQRLDGEPLQRSFLDGIDTTWARVRGSEKLRQALARVRAQFRPEAPHQSLPALADAAAELAALPDNPWKAEKANELDGAIAACAGLWAEATAPAPTVAPGGELAVTVSALDRSPAALKLREIRIGALKASVNQALPVNQPVNIQQTISIPPEAPYSEPYWLTEPPARGLFHVDDPLDIGRPARPPALLASLVVEAGTRALTIERPVIYKWIDPVAGERQRPVEIAPPVTITPATPVLMFPDDKPRELRLVIKAGGAPVKGEARLELPPGWSVTPASAPFNLAEKDDELEWSVRVRPPPHASAPATLRAAATVDGRSFTRGLARIEYPHIPIQTLLPPAEVRLVPFALAAGREWIGYIAGAGDEVAASLRQVGYEVTLLGDEALRGPLDRVQTIVVGVRAFNTNPRLLYLHKKLMDWVAAGGTLVVQYNTNNRISKAPPQIGPYPFEISQERVTDEDAEVRLAPHPLFSRPNKIGPADFAGWVQERGLYFAGKWDKQYETPLEMNDPGEPARKGALLVARHGKGAFIYTGLSFFRQLPAGVPGAYRLFANMISYGRR